MTRAESVVLSSVSRDVAPCPSNFPSPPRSASEVSGPGVFSGPAMARMEALASDLRLALVDPRESAEALS